MRSIELDCGEFGRAKILADSLNGGDDFLLRSNCARSDLELLIFLDSRGVGGKFAGSLIERILKKIEGRKRYLAICRPVDLTLWATLFNFLEINDLRPPKIVTNMGFVDFTPKKQSVLDDTVRQVEARMGPGIAESYPVEHYVDTFGEPIQLFSMLFEPAYRRNVRAVLRGSSTIIINTPVVGPDIRVPRRRPSSFFASLNASNEFNKSLGEATVIDLPVFDESLTYDAVHYTDAGNSLIFSKLEQYL